MKTIHNDLKLTIINAKYPDEFELKVNQFLDQGCWRIVETEMSVTDHHYFAMLVKSEDQPQISAAQSTVKEST